METPNSFLVFEQEISWLQKIINQVIKSYFVQDGIEDNWQDIPLPDLTALDCPYSQTVIEWNLNIYERLALILAITPHIKPEALDAFFMKNQNYDKRFTEFGGVIVENYSGFLPTGQTLNFLIAGNDRTLIAETFKIFNKESRLIKEQVLSLANKASFTPILGGILSIDINWFNYFLMGDKADSC